MRGLGFRGEGCRDFRGSGLGVEELRELGSIGFGG